MIDLGLSASQRAAYLNALHDSHQARFRVRIYDANEQPQRDIMLNPSIVIGGQVNGDASAEVSRSLNLELHDPDGRVHIDVTSPSPYSISPADLIRVVHEIKVDALDDWVACPIFHGPVTGFTRDGDTVTLEAQGKQALHLAPALIWQTITYDKGERVTDVIRDLLQRSGETRFLMETLDAKLPKRLGVSRHDEAWKKASRLADSIGRQLLIDGRGQVRLRELPRRPVFTFYAKQITGRRPPSVAKRPKTRSELASFRNVIEVLGPEPSGSQPRIRSVARPPAQHPLSPESLAFNGKPREHVERIEDSKIKRQADADQRAERELEDRLKISVDAEFEALVMPFLEERDMLGLVAGDDGRYEFRLRSWSIPLTGEPMTINTIRRLKTLNRRGRKPSRREGRHEA